MEKCKYIKWFNEISFNDVGTVGGKNASLGEMYQNLAGQGIKVPNGFAITAEAYRHVLVANKIDERISELLNGLDTQNSSLLKERGKRIRQLFIQAQIPYEIQREILRAYHHLGSSLAKPLDVAVRSSATAEDLPGASFAGQQETYLNVQGDKALLESCLRCFSSLYTDRAISYRFDKGFNHIQIALSIGVQQMVRSDLASSGVMFSIDTETGFKDVVIINSSYGLGENIVQGTVNPDEFYVFKTTLKTGYKPLLQKQLGNKETKLIYDIGGNKMVKNIPVPMDDRIRFSLTDEEILALARCACLIEDHYSKKSGHPVPMDIEWAKDGTTGELFIIQARPETVQSRKQNLNNKVIQSYHLNNRSEVLLQGNSVGEKIASGPVRVIENAKDLDQLRQGEVLVTDKTDPDWEPAMKRAVAVITNRGGRTCHAAIVSRELGLPALVGTEVATSTFKTGQLITVSCAEGEIGFAYEGILDFSVEQLDVSNLGHPKTKIMLNIANPREAFKLSFLPTDGVGLVRMEFIISNTIKIHPMALVNFDRLEDLQLKNKIRQMTSAYSTKADFFIEKLSQGIGSIAAAFYPKEVIVRMSDFKTNEYAELIGGQNFEPHEENPMLGFRGASRYYHPRYQEGFALECKAIKKSRNEMGLTNIKLMIPFCRTPEEGQRVLTELEKNGLRRGDQGLEIYVMCEIPSNVILADQFCEIFDGFSIGSNDLTQLVLGIDRDSEILQNLFDERNRAVKTMITQVIEKAHRHHRKIGICGQAPSDYPDFTEFLVEEKIDSISVNADALVKTLRDVLQIEARIKLKNNQDPFFEDSISF